jgi:endonuclease YncB( thermonuclease family)
VNERVQSLVIAIMTAMAGPVASAGNEVRVIDGGRIAVAGIVHVLYGISAPEPGVRCRLRGRTRDCGGIARAGLMDLTAGGQVACRPAPAHPGKSLCRSDGHDLSEGMIHTGWARASADAPRHLEELMIVACRHHRGLWNDGASGARCPSRK